MEVEEQTPPKATLVVPDKCIWAAIWWMKDCSLPMTMFGHEKADVIKWVRDSSARDHDKPIKLYRLDY